MLDVRFTRRAEDDLVEIYQYTAEHLGADQADAYCRGIANAITLLAEQPLSGRDVTIRAGVRRHEHARHTIFYQVEPDAILIGRILHSASDWHRHLP